MSKRYSWIFFVLLAICTIMTSFYYFTVVMKKDTVPPVLTIESNELVVSVTDKQKLFEGVSAMDDVDKDVTNAIVIEGISNITEDHRATITYAAFDSSGNVSKASRTLIYEDYQPPRFLLERGLLFIDTTSPDVLAFVEAFDLLDGDISHRVKGNLISDTISLSYPGEHLVEFRVSNSMGDTVHLQLPVDVVEMDTYNASVTLTDYLIYVKQGDEFDPKDYMEAFKVGGTNYSLREREDGVRVYIDHYVDPAYDTSGGVLINVTTQSDVDMNTPGVYSVTYTVTMTRGTTYTGFNRLHVVVEE